MILKNSLLGKLFHKPRFSGKELAKHLILISVDAMGESEWELAAKMPNFSYLIKNGASTKSLRSVFPTLTYSVHTSIVTGVYPDKHGIIHNNQLQPGVPENDQRWYWYRDEIKMPTIYDMAAKNNLTSAGLMWPVTGKSSITYNMPEILALKGENQALKVLKNGTLMYLLRLQMRYGKERKGREQPYLDDFVAHCAVDTIKNKKPNLTLVHLVDVDTMKHNYRVESKEVLKALERQDRRIGEIIKAAKDADIYDDTVFIVMSDHGQFNVDSYVHLNNLLKEANLINEQDGRIIWRALCQSSGGSAYVYVNDGDVEAEAKVMDVLKNAAMKSEYGIKETYDRVRLDEMHVDESIRYAVEAVPGYAFKDEMSLRTVEKLKDLGKVYATHGYSPDEPGYKCIFIAAGPGIRKNASIGDIEMVDIAPTISKILGMDFYDCDGRIIGELFEKN